MMRNAKSLPLALCVLALLGLPGCSDSGSGGGTGFADYTPAGTRFFAAFEPGTGMELWKTDGTRAGTMLVKDIDTSPNPYASLGFEALAEIIIIGGEEPWGSNPAQFVTIGGTTFFTADDGIHGRELWKSNGTVAGTMLVADLYPGTDPATGAPYSANPGELVALGGWLFFRATDAGHGAELWKSDGSAAGTTLVRDIYPDTPSGQPEALTAAGATLFFRAYTSAEGYELWKSDGTEAGTVLVKDINPLASSSSPYELTWSADMLFFRADDGINGPELWRSDGTEAGTLMVKDINATSPGQGSYPAQFAVLQTELYFRADDGVNGYELWKSDGTEAGTGMVRDILSGAGNSSSPTWLTALRDELVVFRAYDDISGTELWKSDGTEAGTVLLKDVRSGEYAPGSPFSSYPEQFTPVGGVIYFVARDEMHGKELWATDGTEAGTRIVKDIYPLPEPSGPGSSNPDDLSAADEVVYFVASDYEHGYELWRSDGTEAGTGMIRDINPGVGSAFRGPLGMD